jgi:hypothetical protein
MAQRCRRTIESTLGGRCVGPKVGGGVELQAALRTLAGFLAIRQLGREGNLSAEADRLDPRAQLLPVADPAVSQSGVSGFMNDCRGNHFRRRILGEHKSCIELARVHRLPVARKAVRDYADPQSLDIAQEPSVENAIVCLDEAQSPFDTAPHQFLVSFVVPNPDPQAVNILAAGGKPELDPL